ncbi:hypothetical protein JMN32_15115 [Fulvivirga sp. 29W222]|uniref:RNA polymerase alpha subunit C-terminal domain-containing protein n=1 Tax=Fulvivirga marina TaxID=2494733 RepID=A0A937KC09_9BACT|nr:hypothetical protein [Fulvivirga marina]MBL6447646.1 hypothetical protein [Fulvivirga marina]
MTNSSSKILLTPIDKLSVDRQLIAFMQQHGMRTLEELLRYGVPDLKKMKGFNDDILFQLMDLLHSVGVMHRLSQWPKQ